MMSAGLALTLLGSIAIAQRPEDRDPRFNSRSDRPDDRVPSYSSDAQQLGYEHGYRDGADRGRQDRDGGDGRGQASNDYLNSARYSYRASFGNRGEYMSGYRDGFQ